MASRPPSDCPLCLKGFSADENIVQTNPDKVDIAEIDRENCIDRKKNKFSKNKIEVNTNFQ